MSRHTRCDRCHTEDDLHPRQLIVDWRGSSSRDDDDNTAFDLCGYCWSEFKTWMKT